MGNETRPSLAALYRELGALKQGQAAAERFFVTMTDQWRELSNMLQGMRGEMATRGQVEEVRREVADVRERVTRHQQAVDMVPALMERVQQLELGASKVEALPGVVDSLKEDRARARGVVWLLSFLGGAGGAGAVALVVALTGREAEKPEAAEARREVRALQERLRELEQGPPTRDSQQRGRARAGVQP